MIHLRFHQDAFKERLCRLVWTSPRLCYYYGYFYPIFWSIAMSTAVVPRAFPSLPSPPHAAKRQSRLSFASLHRWYFTAAILITMTLGAFWGASLLWRIS